MPNYFTDEKSYFLRDRGWNLCLAGSIAIALIEKWGAIAGKTGAEDSQGRAYVELSPVEDVVERAFTMAEQSVVALETRGWVKEVISSPS